MKGLVKKMIKFYKVKDTEIRKVAEIDEQGQVIGIITNGKSATDMKNMVCAYGITELKRHIEKMSNGEKFAYLGLKGVGVTEEANSELGVPYGA